MSCYSFNDYGVVIEFFGWLHDYNKVAVVIVLITLCMIIFMTGFNLGVLIRLCLMTC